MKYVLVIILLIALVGIIYFGFWAKTEKVPANDISNNASDNKNQKTQVKNIANGLKIEDIKIGGGAEAKNGSTVTVNYIGTLLDGTKFDSSYDHNQTFSFVVGGGQVIPGWDQGLLGMKVGGKRKLVIPPSLAYGEKGVTGAIPPNSTLIFEIELLKVN